MTELDYKPKHKAFEGSVRLRLPRYKERIKLIRELKFKPEVVDGLTKIDSQMEGLELAERMLDVVETHIVSMSLKHIESGLEFNKLDELDIYSEGSELIGELGNVVLNGVSLGKH